MKRDEVQSLSTSVLTGVYTPITKENPYIPLDWPPGRWTDDTQLTLAVARGLKSGRGFNMDAMVPEHIAELKASSYGWGSSTKGSIQRIVDGTHTWENSGNVKGSGNGVLMKISPLALYWAAVYGPGKNVPQKVQQMSQLARMTHASYAPPTD
jgi:ADP-ribosylglycohydrolase